MLKHLSLSLLGIFLERQRSTKIYFAENGSNVDSFQCVNRQHQSPLTEQIICQLSARQDSTVSCFGEKMWSVCSAQQTFQADFQDRHSSCDEIFSQWALLSKFTVFFFPFQKAHLSYPCMMAIIIQAAAVVWNWMKKSNPGFSVVVLFQCQEKSYREDRKHALLFAIYANSILLSLGGGGILILNKNQTFSSRSTEEKLLKVTKAKN